MGVAAMRLLEGGASFATSRGASLTRCLHEANEAGAAMRLVSCYAARLSEREGGQFVRRAKHGADFPDGRFDRREAAVCDLTRRIANALLA